MLLVFSHHSRGIGYLFERKASSVGLGREGEKRCTIERGNPLEIPKPL